MEQPQSKLLLVPGTGDSPKLANRIKNVLQEIYGMGTKVVVLKTYRAVEVPKAISKRYGYPPVFDSFPDDETRVDIGRNVLFDEIRGTHVAMVKYMFTPKRRPTKTVNDHHMEVRAFLDILKRTERRAETLERTLVAPYLPYLRSHSIEKYDNIGYYQFDSLDLMVQDYHRGRLNNIICIHPHSNKLITTAEGYGINVGAINPFKSSDMINPAKLGLADDKAEDALAKLQPFIEHYKKVRPQYKRICFVSCDDNAETSTEQFHVDCKRSADPERTWNLVGYRFKERVTMEGSTAIWKPFSELNEKTIDPDTTYVFPDDMLSSGGTADGAAKDLKENGAKRVELWCSNPVAPEREKIEKLEYIDKVVALNTVIHENPEKMKIEYIYAAAELLAAELYKVHMRLEATRANI